MSQQPFPDAAPDFSDPIGLLRACHGRIEAHCDTLERLVEHLRDKGVDAEARTAAGRIHHYFSTAGRHHHQDEEQDLFPHLARQSLKLADLVHRLHREHAAMDTLWQQLEPLLQRPAGIDDIDAFGALVQRFTAAYRSHIAVENEELLEMARHILSSAELKKLGANMAARRGVRLNPF